MSDVFLFQCFLFCILYNLLDSWINVSKFKCLPSHFWLKQCIINRWLEFNWQYQIAPALKSPAFVNLPLICKISSCNYNGFPPFTSVTLCNLVFNLLFLDYVWNCTRLGGIFVLGIILYHLESWLLLGQFIYLYLECLHYRTPLLCHFIILLVLICGWVSVLLSYFFLQAVSVLSVLLQWHDQDC